VLQTLNSSNQRSSTSLPLRRRAAAGVRRELLPSATRQRFGSLHHPRRKCLLAQVEGEAQANPPVQPPPHGLQYRALHHSVGGCQERHTHSTRCSLRTWLRRYRHDFGDAFGADVTRKAQDRHGVGRHLKGLTATICPEEAASAPRCFPIRAPDRALSPSTVSSATVFAPCHFG
jgi:hypothetical protein